MLSHLILVDLYEAGEILWQATNRNVLYPYKWMQMLSVPTKSREFIVKIITWTFIGTEMDNKK